MLTIQVKDYLPVSHLFLIITYWFWFVKCVKCVCELRKLSFTPLKLEVTLTNYLVMIKLMDSSET